MHLEPRLPLLPRNARTISRHVAILEDEQRVVIFNAAGPIHEFDKNDVLGRKVAAVNVVLLGLAAVAAVARAFGMHRATLFEYVRLFRARGVRGLEEKQRGPKGPHKFTAALRRQVQGLLDEGCSVAEAAEQVGVSVRGIRRAMAKGLITVAKRAASPVSAPAAQAEAAALLPGPSVRASADQSCEPGVAVKRTGDRVLAATGKLVEAAPEFEAADGVAGAGVLLALPFLLQQGLLRVGEQVYGSLRNGFFGLRSVLLTLAFMALLRIRTPEQLTERAPGELGRAARTGPIPRGEDSASQARRSRGARPGRGRSGSRWHESGCRPTRTRSASSTSTGTCAPTTGASTRFPSSTSSNAVVRCPARRTST